MTALCFNLILVFIDILSITNNIDIILIPLFLFRFLLFQALWVANAIATLQPAMAAPPSAVGVAIVKLRSDEPSAVAVDFNGAVALNAMNVMWRSG